MKVETDNPPLWQERIRTMDYDISDVAQDLSDIGAGRREMAEGPSGRMADDVWVQVSFTDLVRALEEALLQDGDRRRAMGTLILARRQMDVEAFAEKELRRG